MLIRSQLGALRRYVQAQFCARSVTLSNQKPIVSFCFDDFPRSAYLTGGEIIKSLGSRATYYASPALMNTSGDLGDEFTRQDVESLLLDGHELGSHSYTHCSCRHVSAGTFERDVIHGREAIRAMTGCDADHFAYPYGHVTVGLKKRLGPQFGSCRGNHRGVNGPLVDLNLLRANSLYGDIDQLATAAALLVENERRRGWLIFYTHDVQNRPSPYGCTPALLDTVVSWSLEMGFHVAPVGTVVDFASRTKQPSSLIH